MSVLDCIARLHGEGKINDRQRKEAEDIYNGVMGRLGMTMPPASAEARAAVETAEILEKSAQARRLAIAKNAIATQQALDRIQQHPNGPIAGFMGVLSNDPRVKGGLNVEGMREYYRGLGAKEMESILEKFGVKAAGFKQNVAGIRDVIREGFGQDTGNKSAKELAQGWSGMMDNYVDLAKGAGKVFTPADDWRFMQHWESYRARKFGDRALIADWRKEIESGGLKVFDPDTHAEANPIRREQILAAAADKIVKDLPRESSINPRSEAIGGGGAFTNDMRVFRFADGKKGADSYLNLMDKYGIGQGGYMAAMQSHVEQVSNELGLMHVLGPDWRTNGEGLLNKTLDLDLSGKFHEPSTLSWSDAFKSPGKVLKSPIESPTAAKALWSYMSGKNSQVGSEALASIMSGARAFAASRKLGSAIVTAIPTDSVNWLMAAKHLGMDQGRLVSEVARSFLHDTPEARANAAQLGIVSHAGADAAISVKRFSDQLFGERVMQRLSGVIVRGQGLHAWDTAIRRSFLTEFLGNIASQAGRTWEEVDPAFRDHFLVPYGFKPEEWSKLADPANHIKLGEAHFLDPDALGAKDEPLRQKLISGMYDQKQFAYVVGGSARVNALIQGAPAGTVAGEFVRGGALFKRFPMTFLSTWGMRTAMQPSGASVAAAAAQIIAFTTFAGTLTMGAKSLLSGKDWPDMKNPWTWAQAAFTGGALGIYGDFLKEALSRDKTSLLETALGPLASDVTDVMGVVSTEMRDAQEGANASIGGALARAIRNFTPGNNLWYARLMAQRLIFDQIQKMIDPHWAQAFGRQVERSKKIQNQGFFWRPGESAPDRAPSLTPQ